MTLPSGTQATVGVEAYEPRSTVSAAAEDLLPLVPDLMKLTDDKSVVVRVTAIDALLALQPEPSDQAIKRISITVMGVYDVWYPFCSFTQTTTSETTVRALPFRVEKRTRVSNRRGPPTKEDVERAFADMGIAVPAQESDLTTLSFDKQALTPMADKLLNWATVVERRLASRGIKLYERSRTE
jgi:hypothetical protein